MDAIVEYNYVAQEPDELTIRKGDVIKDIKVMPGGWWEGTLRDKRGMFPDNFVKMLETCFVSPTGGSKNDAETSINTIKKEDIALKNGTTGRKWCKVLYSYEPCNEDELQLIPDESVECLGEVEEGWWSGRLRGRVGVFPSNFVSPPVPEEAVRQSNKDPNRNLTGEYCRVLFPYTAANEDELTLVEDEIITILSRDAPDKGWWKGSLRGKVGLFPDNFVKIIDMKEEQEQEMWQDTNQIVSSRISGAKPSSSLSSSSSSSLHTGKRGEKAHVRKSLESNTATFTTSEKKIINHSVVSTNLKQHTEKSETKHYDNAESLGAADEELDGVEREDIPLLHLTASRAKAPRRRLPSSHHVRNQVTNVTMNPTESQSPSLSEETITNGIIDTVDQPGDEEADRLICKTRRKVPWIEELKLNQMEKKKIQPTDKHEKPEAIKKERNYGRSLIQSSSGNELNAESCQDNGDIKSKEKEKDKDTHHRIDSSQVLTSCPVTPVSGSNTPAYVPYRLYSQLLERVRHLEERQTELQRIVIQLSEQLSPSLINISAVSNKL